MMNFYPIDASLATFHRALEFEGGTLDLIDLPLSLPGFSHFLSSWLLRDEKKGRTILVDPGPTSTLPKLLNALKSVGVSCIDYIVLTHIHIDHAGGVGNLLKYFPESKVVAPNRGVKHLIDPSRLQKASLKTLRQVALEYGEMAAVPADAIIPREDLTDILFVDTPGHAPHHHSFYYPLEGENPLLFAGEAAGVFWGDMEGKQFYMRPTTSPRFFFHSAMDSIKLLLRRPCSLLLYAHYGMVRHGDLFLKRSLEQLNEWREKVKREEGGAIPDLVDRILKEDPYVERFYEMSVDEQRRERYFITNSLRGIAEGLADEKKEGASS